MDIEDSTEIYALFTPEFKNEAEIVLQTIEEEKYTIFCCGSTFLEFGKYCKKEIDKHYVEYPEEKLTSIKFERHNMGYDNWEIQRVFKYSSISTFQKVEQNDIVNQQEEPEER